MSETTQKHSMLARLGRWLAELILVFVGVYAAFWLNNYQQGKEQAKRHDQILAYLEQRLEDGISSRYEDPDRAAPTRVDSSRRLECDNAFRETQ